MPTLKNMLDGMWFLAFFAKMGGQILGIKWHFTDYDFIIEQRQFFGPKLQRMKLRHCNSLAYCIQFLKLIFRKIFNYLKKKLIILNDDF